MWRWATLVGITAYLCLVATLAWHPFECVPGEPLAPKIEVYLAHAGTVVESVASALSMTTRIANQSPSSSISLFRSDKMQFVDPGQYRPSWRQHTDSIERLWDTDVRTLADSLSVTLYSNGWTMHRVWGGHNQMTPVASTTDWFMFARAKTEFTMDTSEELRVTMRVEWEECTSVVRLVLNKKRLLDQLDDSTLLHVRTQEATALPKNMISKRRYEGKEGWLETKILNGQFVVYERPLRVCVDQTFMERFVSLSFGIPVALLSAAAPFLYAYAASTNY